MRAEISDSFDEELELEMEEAALDLLTEEGREAEKAKLNRNTYFRELFRLQHELVRLQDWVQHKKLKVVVVFEGRDAAGKPFAPWWVVHANDKKRARLNFIAHLLTQIPYEDVPRQSIALPDRVRHDDYIRHPVPPEMYIPEVY